MGKNFLGGDDVQQLCEAGEEEFLEIMALVGMASKPLHVRRLQKALQEWVSNPGKKLIDSKKFFILINKKTISCQLSVVALQIKFPSKNQLLVYDQ